MGEMNREKIPGEAEYAARLQQLKDALDRANSLRIQAETRLEELSKQEKELVAEIRTYGIEPSELDEHIQKLQQDIESLIGEIEAIIPWELIRSSGNLPERK